MVVFLKSRLVSFSWAESIVTPLILPDSDSTQQHKMIEKTFFICIVWALRCRLAHTWHISQVRPTLNHFSIQFDSGRAGRLTSRSVTFKIPIKGDSRQPSLLWETECSLLTDLSTPVNSDVKSNKKGREYVWNKKLWEMKRSQGSNRQIKT